MTTADNQFDDLRHLVRKLNPTGPDGFEGLIGAVLTDITKTSFGLANSGSQRGKDGQSVLNDGAMTRCEPCAAPGQRPARSVRCAPLLVVPLAVTARLMLPAIFFAFGRNLANASQDTSKGKSVLTGTYCLVEGDGNPFPMSLDRGELKAILLAGFLRADVLFMTIESGGRLC